MGAGQGRWIRPLRAKLRRAGAVLDRMTASGHELWKLNGEAITLPVSVKERGHNKKAMEHRVEVFVKKFTSRGVVIDGGSAIQVPMVETFAPNSLNLKFEPMVEVPKVKVTIAEARENALDVLRQAEQQRTAFAEVEGGHDEPVISTFAGAMAHGFEEVKEQVPSLMGALNDLEDRVEEVKVAKVAKPRKRTDLTCEACGFKTDWHPAMARHRIAAHGAMSKAAMVKAGMVIRKRARVARPEVDPAVEVATAQDLDAAGEAVVRSVKILVEQNKLLRRERAALQEKVDRARRAL